MREINETSARFIASRVAKRVESSLENVLGARENRAPSCNEYHDDTVYEEFSTADRIEITISTLDLIYSLSFDAYRNYSPAVLSKKPGIAEAGQCYESTNRV